MRFLVVLLACAAACVPRSSSSLGDAGTPAPQHSAAWFEGYGVPGTPCAECLRAHCYDAISRLEAKKDEQRALLACERGCANDSTYAACMKGCMDAHHEVFELQAAVGACSVGNCKPLCD